MNFSTIDIFQLLKQLVEIDGILIKFLLMKYQTFHGFYVVRNNPCRKLTETHRASFFEFMVSFCVSKSITFLDISCYQGFKFWTSQSDEMKKLYQSFFNHFSFLFEKFEFCYV